MIEHYHYQLMNAAARCQSPERIVSLCWHALNCQDVPGDYCEFGVYQGHTAVLLATMVDKKWWLYDSFQGLPESQPGDVVNSVRFGKGDLNDASASEVYRLFQNGLQAKPTIVQKFFRDIQPQDLPEKIAFAHLDGDLGDSILCSLELVYPRCSKGAVIVIDDYGNAELPGVERAVSRFMLDKPEKVIQSMGLLGQKAIQAYFKKL